MPLPLGLVSRLCNRRFTPADVLFKMARPDSPTEPTPTVTADVSRLFRQAGAKGKQLALHVAPFATKITTHFTTHSLLPMAQREATVKVETETGWSG